MISRHKRSTGLFSLCVMVVSLFLLGVAPVLAVNPAVLSAEFTTDTNLKITFDQNISTRAITAGNITSNSSAWAAVSAARDGGNNAVVNLTVSGVDPGDQDGIESDLDIAANTVEDALSETTNAEVINQNIAADTTKPTMISAAFTTSTNMDIILSE